MTIKNLNKIAQRIAESEWIKFHSKSDKQGWKKKVDGSFEYRYQDEDPNKKKHKIDIPELKKFKGIKRYTNVGYSSVNNYLRKIKENVTESTKELVKRINNELDLLPPYNGIVYRGIKNEENKSEYLMNYLLSLSKGDVIKSAGFLSTSLEPKTAYIFSSSLHSGDLGGQTEFIEGSIFKIKSKEGKQINHLSKNHEDEKEVLFKSGTKFKINSVKKGLITEDLNNIKSYKIVIEMEETEDDLTQIPIKDMDITLFKNFLKKKDLTSDQKIRINSINEKQFKQIKKRIIQKHGPYYII